MKYLFAYLPVIFSGLGLVLLFLRFRYWNILGILIVLSLSFFIGVSLTSSVLFFFFFLKIPFVFTQTTLYLTGIVCFGIIFFVRDKNILLSVCENEKKKITGLQILIGLICLSVASYILQFALLSNDTMFKIMPNGYFDAFAIWNFKSRLIFLKPFDYDVIFPLANQDIQHHDYPYLSYFFNAYVFHAIGKINYEVPYINSILYTYITLLFVFSIITFLKNILIATILIATILYESYFLYMMGNSQYADTPLASYFIVTACLFLLAENIQIKSKNGVRILLGFICASSALVKNEGLLFLLFFSGLFFLYLYLVQTGNFINKVKSYLWYFTGIIIPFLFLRIFKMINLCRNDLFKDFTINGLFDSLLDTQRYNIILMKLYELIHGQYLEMLIVILLIVLLLGVTKNKIFYLQSGLLLALVIVVWAGYFLIYILTPHDLVWHVNTSADRLLMHVATIFKIAVVFLLPSNYKIGKKIEY